MLQHFNKSAGRIKKIPAPNQAHQVKGNKLIVGKRIWHYNPYKTVKWGGRRGQWTQKDSLDS